MGGIFLEVRNEIKVDCIYKGGFLKEGWQIINPASEENLNLFPKGCQTINLSGVTLSYTPYPLCFETYLQSKEILLNLSMKCWNSAF